MLLFILLCLLAFIIPIQIMIISLFIIFSLLLTPPLLTIAYLLYFEYILISIFNILYNPLGIALLLTIICSFL